MRGLRRGSLLGRVVLLGLGILGLGRRGRGIERVFLLLFADFGFYSIAHRYTTMVVLTMDGWEFFCNASNTVEC